MERYIILTKYSKAVIACTKVAAHFKYLLLLSEFAGVHSQGIYINLIFFFHQASTAFGQ